MTGNTSDAISGLTIANGNVPGSLGGGGQDLFERHAFVTGTVES
jgi:hypothetical protein